MLDKQTSKLDIGVVCALYTKSNYIIQIQISNRQIALDTAQVPLLYIHPDLLTYTHGGWLGIPYRLRRC